jgi:putative spermidine/putrescine transport system ATP-binding protein
MDEPLSNLDAKLRLEMRSEIKRLHRELGFTTVYVTHDQEEALSLADRVVVLRDGVAQQIGSPEAVYAQPVNLYVASFMGYRNTYELNVERVDGRRVRLSEPGLRLLATVGGDGGMELGTRAVAAIRPEDLVLGEAGGANRITASVDVVEYQGRENAVGALTASDRRIVFRTSARVAVGERVVLSAPPERVLAFPTDAAALAAAGTSA